MTRNGIMAKAQLGKELVIKVKKYIGAMEVMSDVMRDQETDK